MTKIPDDQAVLARTIRGWSRVTPYGRDLLYDQVRQGLLPAVRNGRAWVVLATDFERWHRSRLHEPTAHAERRVAELLDREAM